MNYTQNVQRLQRKTREASAQYLRCVKDVQEERVEFSDLIDRV